ncbi:uncharacterized protein PAC_07641 [Phialocephala subalpina]|uniref:DUF1479 domain protein n=1 Tax=Phialocephala subalpina TaxID=576137 RepID=A0A1L7WYA7_9HELO|nr:uncharacterized protein PAC_07641 [Phialocephala subalpina]
MPSKTTSWPSGWPSFTPKDNDPTDTFQKDLKASIIAEYGADNLKVAWIKTCNALSEVTSRLASQGNTSVPIFQADDALSDSKALDAMREAGCCIIRGVIPKPKATQYFEDLKTFIADNKETVTGWPAKSVAIYHLYSSPTQLKIKTTPRHLQIQRLLNSLWTDSSLSSVEQAAQNEPILYPDGLRIRQPRQEFLGLGPHIDGGSLSRWADRSYRKTYDAILSGKPEEYDPYDMAYRKLANPAMFPGGAQCSVMRAFQGWTAFTPCKPGEGGLMLVPNLKVVTAYMILRPFFKAPEGDWRNAESWEVDDESGWFPGTYRWDSQLLSPESHPHLYLKDTLMSVPDMEPGDTIWWHTDMCHAVETTHNGPGPASVCYIPAAPSTPGNVTYIKQHWKDLVAGVPPEDYKYLDGAGSELVLSQQNERKMKGALSLDDISVEGRRALGDVC